MQSGKIYGYARVSSKHQNEERQLIALRAFGIRDRDMSNYKIAVLGDKDSVLGFKALGLDVFPAESAEEAKRTLHALAEENYAVVYLTEGYAAHMEAELERYKDALTPAIILIPGKDGSLGIGMANVKRAVERAVGADIL